MAVVALSALKCECSKKGYFRFKIEEFRKQINRIIKKKETPPFSEYKENPTSAE